MSERKTEVVEINEDGEAWWVLLPAGHGPRPNTQEALLAVIGYLTETLAPWPIDIGTCSC